MNTLSEFGTLVSQRYWDKDIAVWVGSEAALQAAFPANVNLTVTTLDLLDLFDENKLPDSDEEVARFLGHRLGEKLKTLAPLPGQKCLLIVRSAGLLVRHNLGLKEFFQWFCGDRALAVLLVEAVPERLDLPMEVECRPGAIVSYFYQPDLAKHCFSAA